MENDKRRLRQIAISGGATAQRAVSAQRRYIIKATPCISSHLGVDIITLQRVYPQKNYTCAISGGASPSPTGTLCRIRRKAVYHQGNALYIITLCVYIITPRCGYHRTARYFAPPNIKSRQTTAFYHFGFVVWVLVSQPSTVSRIAGIHTMRMPQIMATKRQESTVLVTVTSYLSIIKPARLVSSSFM